MSLTEVFWAKRMEKGNRRRVMTNEFQMTNVEYRSADFFMENIFWANVKAP
jgi:hypothetical protein